MMVNSVQYRVLEVRIIRSGFKPFIDARGSSHEPRGSLLKGLIKGMELDLRIFQVAYIDC